jgi:hypothetical protein
LFQRKRTRIENIAFIIICLALVLSSASSGIIGLGLLFFIFLFRRTEGKSIFRKIGLITIAVALVAFYLIRIDSSATLVNRLISGGSVNQRITRGLLVYGELPIYHKLFGVGINNLQPYMQYYNMSTLYDETNLNLSCSMVQTLNYSGIAGFASLMIYLHSLKKKCKSTTGIAYFWLLVFIVSYETILFTYRFGFLVIMLEGIERYYHIDTKSSIERK